MNWEERITDLLDLHVDDTRLSVLRTAIRDLIRDICNKADKAEANATVAQNDLKEMEDGEAKRNFDYGQALGDKHTASQSFFNGVTNWRLPACDPRWIEVEVTSRVSSITLGLLKKHELLKTGKP